VLTNGRRWFIVPVRPFEPNCRTRSARPEAELKTSINRRGRKGETAAIASNVLSFTTPANGIYMFGLGATYEDTGGSAPTKMQVGLSVNGAAPTGGTIGTAGDATISSAETQTQITALLQLGQGDEMNPKIFFTSNDGRVLADELLLGCLVA
jgi:hypothetical protein